jgi:hypothetical protein
MTQHRHRPLCEVCEKAPAELKFNGIGWKKRCADCEHARQLQTDRERMAQRKIARLEAAR